jgi:hypothetical protein
MKYIAIPIDEIDTVMEICVGEVNRYTDILENDPTNIGAQMLKSKWQGKAEALGELLRFGTECNELK